MIHADETLADRKQVMHIELSGERDEVSVCCQRLTEGHKWSVFIQL